MLPVVAGEIARSLQSISDQELQGTVEADVRQRRLVGALTFELWRPEAEEAEIACLRSRSGEPAKGIDTVEQSLGVRGQITRKGRDLCIAVEKFAVGALASRGRPQDRRQFVAATRDLCLASS